MTAPAIIGAGNLTNHAASEIVFLLPPGRRADSPVKVLQRLRFRGIFTEYAGSLILFIVALCTISRDVYFPSPSGSRTVQEAHARLTFGSARCKQLLEFPSQRP